MFYRPNVAVESPVEVVAQLLDLGLQQVLSGSSFLIWKLKIKAIKTSFQSEATPSQAVPLDRTRSYLG